MTTVYYQTNYTDCTTTEHDTYRDAMNEAVKLMTDKSNCKLNEVVDLAVVITNIEPGTHLGYIGILQRNLSLETIMSHDRTKIVFLTHECNFNSLKEYEGFNPISLHRVRDCRNGDEMSIGSCVLRVHSND